MSERYRVRETAKRGEATREMIQQESRRRDDLFVGVTLPYGELNLRLKRQRFDVKIFRKRWSLCEELESVGEDKFPLIWKLF